MHSLPSLGTANPSLHPTAYSGHRPLPSVGELKRQATFDPHAHLP
jgi:hypothetical protein